MAGQMSQFQLKLCVLPLTWRLPVLSGFRVIFGFSTKTLQIYYICNYRKGQLNFIIFSKLLVSA